MQSLWLEEESGPAGDVMSPIVDATVDMFTRKGNEMWLLPSFLSSFFFHSPPTPTLEFLLFTPYPANAKMLSSSLAI